MSENTTYNNLYSKRPETPLGEAYGLTSTPVSQNQSGRTSPLQPVDYYRYQPAMTWTHPHCFPNKTSHYNEASVTKDEPLSANRTSHQPDSEVKGQIATGPKTENPPVTNKPSEKKE
jgi:hypothetical protein